MAKKRGKVFLREMKSKYKCLRVRLSLISSKIQILAVLKMTKKGKRGGKQDLEATSNQIRWIFVGLVKSYFILGQSKDTEDFKKQRCGQFYVSAWPGIHSPVIQFNISLKTAVKVFC